ncbi:MAG: polymer-forming cytoskeletal protein [Chloroflexota bacterium]|nr:polymer-forming cytoskeletal protein [Chloroflexota bacterium]
MAMRPTTSDDYRLSLPDDPARSGAENPSQSLIDRFSNFDGTFRAERDLRIEGEVKGTITCDGHLFVAEGANVSAKVEAESISVAGRLEGDIQCRGRLHILASGQLRGKVSTETLVIDEGAFYEGGLEMTDPDKRLSAGKPARQLSAISGGGRRPEPRGRDRLAAPEPEVTEGDDAPPAAVDPHPAPASTSGSPANTTFIRRRGGPETPWGTEQDDPAATPGSPPPR